MLQHTLFRALSILEGFYQGVGVTTKPHDSRFREGETREQQQGLLVQDAVGELQVDPVVQNDFVPAVRDQVAQGVFCLRMSSVVMRAFERRTHLSFTVRRARMLMSF